MGFAASRASHFPRPPEGRCATLFAVAARYRDLQAVHAFPRRFRRLSVGCRASNERRLRAAPFRRRQSKDPGERGKRDPPKSVSRSEIPEQDPCAQGMAAERQPEREALDR